MALMACKWKAVPPAIEAVMNDNEAESQGTMNMMGYLVSPWVSVPLWV